MLPSSTTQLESINHSLATCVAWQNVYVADVNALEKGLDALSSPSAFGMANLVGAYIVLPADVPRRTQRQSKCLVCSFGD